MKYEYGHVFTNRNDDNCNEKLNILSTQLNCSFAAFEGHYTEKEGRP